MRVTPGPMASPEKPSVGRALSSIATFASSRAREGENRLVHVTTGDANIGFHHKGNSISTGKYNLATFFPKGVLLCAAFPPISPPLALEGVGRSSSTATQDSVQV